LSSSQWLSFLKHKAELNGYAVAPQKQFTADHVCKWLEQFPNRTTRLSALPLFMAIGLKGMHENPPRRD